MLGAILVLGLGTLAGFVTSCSVVNAPGSGGNGAGPAGGTGGGTTHTTTSSGATGGEGGTDCGPLTTLQNCGACGHPCTPAHASGATCATGSCQYSACDAAYHDCDADASNGCESDPQTDAANCGECGHDCGTLGYQHVTGTTCSGATCGYAACEPLYGDCDGATTLGCETPLTSLTDCAACGTPCSPTNATGPTCANGTCGYALCTGTYQDCDGDTSNGCESDRLTDSSHCGNCNTSCGGNTPSCANGQCGPACGSDCWGATGCLTPGGHCIRFSCRAGTSPPNFCSQCWGGNWQEITVNDWLNGGYCADVTAEYRVVAGQTTQCGGSPVCCASAAACAGSDNAWHFSDGAQTYLLGPTLGDYGSGSMTNCTYWNSVESSSYTRITACRMF